MMALPPGQRARPDFPRFGLLAYAGRFPREPARRRLAIGGEVEQPFEFDGDAPGLPRVEQLSDLHCVTTWSACGLRWGGVPFAALYEHHIAPRVRPRTCWVVLRGQDGYRSPMLLDDLLQPGVLLADRLNGEPLPIAHGAPWRLVAPAHYGYKQVKHLSRIDFVASPDRVHTSAFRFMDHPRGRVALEERGRGAPGWLLRWLYRPLIGSTVARFERALQAHRARTDVAL